MKTFKTFQDEISDISGESLTEATLPTRFERQKTLKDKVSAAGGVDAYHKKLQATIDAAGGIDKFISKVKHTNQVKTPPNNAADTDMEKIQTRYDAMWRAGEHNKANDALKQRKKDEAAGVEHTAKVPWHPENLILSDKHMPIGHMRDSTGNIVEKLSDSEQKERAAAEREARYPTGRTYKGDR